MHLLTFPRAALMLVQALRQRLPTRSVLATTLAGAAAALCIGVAKGATLTVTNLADGGAGSLRDAIATANTSVGVEDTINFSVSGTITLISRLPSIDDDVTIDGEGQSIKLSGNNAVQVLFVSAGKTLKLARITIANGFCASPCSGGAILNVGTLRVSSSTFMGNSALLGGAIHNFGKLEVSGSTFSRNSARFGGAIHNFYSSTVTGSKFLGNSATHTGGAIYNFDTLHVISSAFSGNSAIGASNDVFNGAEVATPSVQNGAYSWDGVSCVASCSASFDNARGTRVLCETTTVRDADPIRSVGCGAPHYGLASVR